MATLQVPLPSRYRGEMKLASVIAALAIIATPACSERLTLLLAETGLSSSLDEYAIYYNSRSNDPGGDKSGLPLEELVAGGSFRSLSLGAWQSSAFHVDQIYYLVLNERGQALFNVSFSGSGQNLWWYFNTGAFQSGLPLPDSTFYMSRVGDPGFSFRVWQRSDSSRLFLAALNAALFLPSLHTLLLLSSSDTFSTLTPSGYQGCLLMTNVESQLTIALLRSNMTVIMCVQECDSKGSTHAALKGGDVCLCGTNLTTGRAGTCDIRCKGDSRFFCGGSSAASVFQISAFKDFGTAIASIMAANDPINAQQAFSLELSEDEEVVELDQTTHVTSVALSHYENVSDAVTFTLTYSGVTDANCSDPAVTYLPLLESIIEPNSTEEVEVVINVTTVKDVALARMSCLKVKRSWSGPDTPPNVTLQAFGPTGDFIVVPAVAVQVDTSPATTVKTTTGATTLETTTEATCDCCDLCPLPSTSALTDLLTTCYGLLPGSASPGNLSLEEYVDLVQTELKVVKSALSAERRKHTSVGDDRPSAQRKTNTSGDESQRQLSSA